MATVNPDFGRAETLIRVVQHAEALGYSLAFTADHIFVPDYWRPVVGDEWYDPFTLLAYLAAQTKSIRLLAGCLVVPYRHPFGVAKAVASLDQLSGGRFILGVVPGYLKEEFEVLRVPRQERGVMTDEFIRIMQALWTSERASFAGKYYQFENVNLRPKCVQQPHPPIWAGGSYRRAIRRAVELGSGWFPIAFPVIDKAYARQHAAELQHSYGLLVPHILASLARYEPDNAPA